jgi:copper chaperone CopZ
MKIIITFILALTALFASAQTKNTTEVKIKTSAVCETCKETIEHGLSFEKGVKSVRLDLENKMVTVVYLPTKTNEDKIRVALTNLGYDADSLKANPKAFGKLPECCRNPDHHN